METVKRIEDLLTPYMESQGLRLYKVVFSSGGKRKKVIIYADGKEAAVTVDQLAALNRFAGDVLEAEDLINGSYMLEVSSPGLAKLTEERDFKFFTGRYCKVVVENKTIYGDIKGYENDVLILETKEGETLNIEKDKIVKAKLDIDF